MSASMNSSEEFGRIRRFFWPVHAYELKKFLPLFLMFFFVCLNYSLLKVVKDTLVVNAPGSGADILPWLKLWCVLPAALIFMSAYVKLSTMVNRHTLFYVTLAPFVLYYLIFPFFIMPYASQMHPTVSADWLQSVLPEGLRGLVAIYRNWTFALFYVLSDLWGSVVLSTLYWGFVNEITAVSEAKRFYGLLGIGANVALLFVMPLTRLAGSMGSWEKSFNFMMGLILFGCFGTALCYWFVNQKVLTDERFILKEKPAGKKKKQKMGFKDSLSVIAGSRYLMCIVVLVLAYGISANLVDVTWKHNVKKLFSGSRQQYMEFQGIVSSTTGLLTIFCLYFGTGNLLQKFGWKVTAILTPVIITITSLVFFFHLNFQDLIMGLYSGFAMSPLLIVVWCGGVQNILSRATKYSFFDPSKELAYIPLDSHTKKVGKAAIDGFAGRLGKSGGSAINMMLIALMGSVDAIAPIIPLFLTGIVIAWFVSVFSIDREFTRLEAEQ